jgi:hypothetical protein
MKRSPRRHVPAPNGSNILARRPVAEVVIDAIKEENARIYRAGGGRSRAIALLTVGLSGAGTSVVDADDTSLESEFHAFRPASLSTATASAYMSSGLIGVGLR